MPRQTTGGVRENYCECGHERIYHWPEGLVDGKQSEAECMVGDCLCQKFNEARTRNDD